MRREFATIDPTTRWQVLLDAEGVLLVDHGYVMRELIEDKQPGRPPSARYHVHPLIAEELSIAAPVNSHQDG